MMHEFTLCVVEVAMPSRFGQSGAYRGGTTDLSFGTGPRPARTSAAIAEWVPARAVLALLCGQLYSEWDVLPVGW